MEIINLRESEPEEMAMKLLLMHIAALQEIQYGEEFVIPSSISTLITTAKDFPSLMFSPNYERLKHSVIAEIKILEQFEARAAKEQGRIFREHFDMLMEVEHLVMK